MSAAPSLLERAAAFGPVETRALSRIQQLTGQYLARNWQAIPHVTHHDDVDMGAVEAARALLAQRHPVVGKVSPVAFIVKALALTLQAFPQFNAAFDEAGNQLVLRKYCHIGIAIDTPRGLVVGVVRDCDTKPVTQIAADMAALADKARGRGLPMADSEGSCMTVSSLGALGGTGFTPIINAPEVAILGVSKAEWKAARGVDDGIEWQLKAPLSLSYDHRVINGADAGRFMRRLHTVLAAASAMPLE